MNAQQREEIKLREEILEVLARSYRHAELLPRIKRLKKAKDYEKAISSIHDIEKKIESKKHESFVKKLKKKFRKKKGIKRKKR